MRSTTTTNRKGSRAIKKRVYRVNIFSCGNGRTWDRGAPKTNVFPAHPFGLYVTYWRRSCKEDTGGNGILPDTLCRKKKRHACTAGPPHSNRTSRSNFARSRPSQWLMRSSFQSPTPRWGWICCCRCRCLVLRMSFATRMKYADFSYTRRRTGDINDRGGGVLTKTHAVVVRPLITHSRREGGGLTRCLAYSSEGQREEHLNREPCFFFFRCIFFSS